MSFTAHLPLCTAFKNEWSCTFSHHTSSWRAWQIYLPLTLPFLLEFLLTPSYSRPVSILCAALQPSYGQSVAVLRHFRIFMAQITGYLWQGWANSPKNLGVISKFYASQTGDVANYILIIPQILDSTGERERERGGRGRGRERESDREREAVARPSDARDLCIPDI